MLNTKKQNWMENTDLTGFEHSSSSTHHGTGIYYNKVVYYLF